jgi:hypothetical protein
MTLCLEGVTWLLFDAVGGILCGVIDSRGFPFALGLDGEGIEGKDNVDFETEPLEGVLDTVVRDGYL